MDHAQIAPIAVTCLFADFEAFRHPFSRAAGPAPGYCASLDPAARAALKDSLRRRLDRGGPISLPARAWGVRVQV